MEHQTKVEAKEKGSDGVFIFPRGRKGLHWWFWICCPFRRGPVFWTGLSFPLSSLSSSRSRPAAGGRLVKSAAVCSVIKIIQVLLGLPQEGSMGAWGLSGYTAQFASLPRKNRTVIYCTSARSHWETEGPLKAQRWDRCISSARGSNCMNQHMGVLTTRWYLNCSSNNGSLSL